MTKQEAIDHFGGVRELAEALGVSTPAVYQWEDIPIRRQYEIERLTGGVLKAAPLQTNSAA